MQTKGRRQREAEGDYLSKVKSRAGNLPILIPLFKPLGKTVFLASSLTSSHPPSKSPPTLQHVNFLQISNTCREVKCYPMQRIWWTCLEKVTQDTYETLHIVIGLKYKNGSVCSVRLIWQALNALCSYWKRLSFPTAPQPRIRCFLHDRVLLQTLTTYAHNIFLKWRPRICSFFMGTLPRANDSCPLNLSTSIHANKHLSLRWLQKVAEGTHGFAHSIPSLAWVHFLTVKAGDLLSQAAPPAAHWKHSCYAKITMKARTCTFLEKAKRKTHWPTNSTTDSRSYLIRCNPTSGTSLVLGPGSVPSTTLLFLGCVWVTGQEPEPSPLLVLLMQNGKSELTV